MRRWRTRWRLALVLAGCWLGPAAGGVSLAADTPWLEYSVIHHLLEESEPRPLLVVWPDGRVRAHRPEYMRRAGDYTMVLPPAELEHLRGALLETGLYDLDVERARTERRQAAAGTLYHVSDSTETVIRFGDPAGRSIEIRWTDVHSDRRRFPELSGVATVFDAERVLRQLLDHPDLQRAVP